jgi:hypothetical protein
MGSTSHFPVTRRRHIISEEPTQCYELTNPKERRELDTVSMLD